MSGPGTWIVTGGCGFVGANLAATLESRHDEHGVVIIDPMRTGSFATLAEACRRIAGAPFRGEVIPEGVERVDWPVLIARRRPRAIFHLGAITDTTVRDEAEMIRVNAGESWRAMLAAAADMGVPLVYASSAATYGTPSAAAEHRAFREDEAGHPSNVYGFSKWLMECAHRRFVAERRAAGAPEPWVVGLRYFNVFGPGEAAKGKMASMAYQLTRQVIAGGRPKLFADGTQIRDQVPVEDIVGITLAGAGLGSRPDPAPGVYNAGSGVATTFEQVASAVRAGLGVSGPDRPTEFFEMPASIAAFYQSFTLADMASAAEGLGFRPAHHPVEAVQRYARYLADTVR